MRKLLIETQESPSEWNVTSTGWRFLGFYQQFPHARQNQKRDGENPARQLRDRRPPQRLPGRPAHAAGAQWVHAADRQRHLHLARQQLSPRAMPLRLCRLCLLVATVAATAWAQTTPPAPAVTTPPAPTTPAPPIPTTKSTDKTAKTGKTAG